MHILRLIVLIVSMPVIGQVSDEGRYSADFSSGCAPFTINLTEHDPFGAIVRQYAYENSDQFTTDLSYTYTTPGSFEIVQVVGTDLADPKTDTLRIEVFDPTSPTFIYYLCDNREVLVEIDDEYYDQYEITFAGTSSATIPNQTTATYQYQLSDELSLEVRGIFTGAKDNCTPSTLFLSEVIDDLSAPPIQSASITQTCEDRFDLNISTNTSENVIYQITLDQGMGSETVYEGLLEDESAFQISNFDETQTEFNVQLNAYNICSDNYLEGTPSSIEIVDGGLDPVKNLFSTYQDNNVLISLDQTSLGSFRIDRSFDQSSYSQHAIVSQSHLDDTGFLGRQYYYRVSYLDTCNGSWNVKDTSPPFIKALPIETNKYQIEFKQAMLPSDESISYSAILSGNGETEETSITASSFELTIPPNMGKSPTLVINGTSDSYQLKSNILSLEYEFLIHVPRAFTPNGDGLNDRLEFFGIDNSQAELKIYNRWGQQIYYEISSAPAWDGRINGKLATDGIYIYEISVPQLFNQVQKGTFALIKR